MLVDQHDDIPILISILSRREIEQVVYERQNDHLGTGGDQVLADFGDEQANLALGQQGHNTAAICSISRAGLAGISHFCYLLRPV